MNEFDEVYTAAHASNDRTHAGHWLLALLFFLIGWAWQDVETGIYGATVGFVYRELSDILAAKQELGSWQLAIRVKGLDGYLDAFYAFLGMSSGAALAIGGLAAFLPAVLFSAGVWAMLYFAKYRKEGL